MSERTECNRAAIERHVAMYDMLAVMPLRLDEHTGTR
jgi:hypothetical protein